MSQLDKTRERIKIEELDNNDRKELFNKFVKGGGQVVSEKPKRAIKIDRQKQKELAARMDAHRKKMQSSAGSSSTPQKSSITSNPQSPAPVASGLDLLVARFRLYFMGVSNLGGDHFKKKFLEQFKVEYNPALMELQMIYLDIFKQNPAVGHKIIEQMDKNRPLYYELAEMTGDIWEKSISSQIIDNYTVMPDEKYRIYEHRDPVLAYLKKLYILSRYVDTIYFSFDKAIEFQARIEKGKSAVYAAKRKKIKNSLFVTFNKLYPRLYWLFCLMRGEIVSLEETGRLDQLFNIKPFMKPGNRMANQPPSHLSSFIDATGKLNPDVNEEETASSEPEQPIEDEIEEAHIPEDVRRGLDIMQEIDFTPLKKSYAKDDIMRTVSENDKILQTYLLFLEFDREYSFVLTTYKIKFNPLHDSRGRIDFRTKLTDIYNQMRPCFDALKEYFVALDIYEKARLDRPSSHDQYYKYSKRLAELEQDKKNKARNARTQISNYMGNIADALLTLIQDMNVRNEIIQNPQDMIEFDNSLESDRKLNNKKIFEAVVTTHSYASAFYYRLSPLGDLSGDTSAVEQPPAVQNAPVAETPAPTLVKTVKSQPVQPQEIIPEPAAQPQKVSEEKKPEPLPIKEEPDQPAIKRPENDSILGELDDIDKLDDLL